MIVPTRTYLLVKPDEEGDVTKGGIYLVKKTKDYPKTGKVISVGPDVTLIQVGDTVIFKAFAGNEYEHEKEKLLFIIEADILGTLNE